MSQFKFIAKKYIAYVAFLEKKSQKNFLRFTKWLLHYIRLKSNDHTFKSTYLPRYEEGQIIFVDFGCGIGHEFSYPHYAIVLNIKDMKKNSLLTVVPMTSKKEKHKILKPWEHELKQPIPSLLGEKALANFDLEKPEYAGLKNDLVQLALQNVTKEDFDKKYAALLAQGVQSIYESNKAIMELREKMKEGSIVETNQIKTISKARILFPTKKSHPLYSIRINPYDLREIKYKIIQNIILSDVDNIPKERL